MVLVPVPETGYLIKVRVYFITPFWEVKVISVALVGA
jgi:hypothetical protein